MSTKSLSINSASGADSTQAQEQVVKSFSSSSSNLNNVEVDDEVQEFAELDEDEREAYEAFLDVICDSRISVEDFRDAYQGEWDSEEDFARHIVEECGMFDNLPESVKDYFDFGRYADDLFRYDYDFQDGHVFLCC